MDKEVGSTTNRDENSGSAMVNDYFCRLELCWNIARRRMRFDFLVQHLLVSKSNFTQRPFLVVNQDPNILLTGRSLLGARDNES